MEFEQIVCYTQSIIILLLLIGYLINYTNSKESVFLKRNLECSSCGQNLLGKEQNYCSNCGHMISHSKGSKLEK